MAAPSGIRATEATEAGEQDEPKANSKAKTKTKIKAKIKAKTKAMTKIGGVNTGPKTGPNTGPKTPAVDSGPRTLFVGNLPQDFQANQLQNLFGDVGPIRRCFLVDDKNTKKSKGVGYVTFALSEDAAKAVETVKAFNGKKLNVKFAPKKFRPKSGDVEEPATDGQKKSSKIQKTKTKFKFISGDGRIIVRNLSFKATEDEVRDAFSKFGKVTDIQLLKSADGRLVGCGFVQFLKINSGKLAIDSMNAKIFLGRTIAVDWAIPKAKYQSHQQGSPLKSHAAEETDAKEKEKPVGIKSGAKIADEDEDKDESDDDENEDGDDDEDDDDGENDDDDGEDDDEEEDNSGPSRKSLTNNQGKTPRPTDVDEGCTLFIRNVPFDATKESLYEAFSQFGKLDYAVICMDKFTELSRGTAFVKFKLKDDCEHCLQKAIDQSEDGGITINGNRVSVCLAVSREDMQQKFQEKKKKQPKDNRNLYLVREGLIRPGSKAAEGVSQSDINQRLKVETWKRTMLRNLNVFVSSNRLCIRNLPESVDDTKLRNIFRKAAGPDAIIKEARVIRDRRILDSHGVGKSKGFGFVCFLQHEHALEALRFTNNNPEIFTKDKRPLVEFSLENKAALNAKRKRLEKSVEENKQHQEYQSKESDGTQEYCGTTAVAGVGKLPSHTGPKVRHAARNVKKHKKISRKQFSAKQQQKESRKRQPSFQNTEEPPKKRKKPEEDFMKKYEVKHDEKNFGQKRKVPKKNKWFN